MLIKRLKEARLRTGLSQYKLGVLAGLDEATSSARMNQYEKGKHQADLEMAMRIARVLDLPLAYFYAEEDELAALIIEFHQHKSNR
ncbi:helix-turn-helix domain-containing protein [Rouxiella sp. Mn2063]|uniref:helix-turn-helix domain-containing protein n=1 Tax=Rouxiella sp. Mn2063 TaxID=3395262 RepID=UPI003BDEA7E8